MRAAAGCAVLLALLQAAGAWASGPRWFGGQPYTVSTQWGQPVKWTQPVVQYFTDPGDLAGGVSHAQADATVAAAAAAWNLPISALTLSQGGTLTEHVSSANVTLADSGLRWPADVQPVDAPAKAVAVIYDTDGSVTDLLLGAGASETSSCRQNAVTSTVDDIDVYAAIRHATIIVNGRCAGPSADQMAQLKYLLIRAWGRVLGLAWSQLNDDVFTGVPEPSVAEMQAWPVMHPIDIVCGPWTYQCMISAFMLREEDISSLLSLYPVFTSDLSTGKQFAYSDGSYLQGVVTFPDGTGMTDVNVVARRWTPFQNNLNVVPVVSGLSGNDFQTSMDSPITGPISGQAAGNGVPASHIDYEGLWKAGKLNDAVWTGWILATFSTESINPLYSGNYAVGPYLGPPIAISGSPQTSAAFSMSPGGWGFPGALVQMDAAGPCDTAGQAVESSPAAIDPSGWWNGSICGMGQAAWRGLTVAAGHEWALEVTALNESGLATGSKMLPVAGVWNSSDPLGTQPTLAAAAVPLNANATGTTLLQQTGPATDQALRLAIADSRMLGRPDFAYRARILYAAAVTPAAVSTDGGVVTITGTGFRAGNRVLVNGVAATATAWTPTTITAMLPAAASAGAAVGVPVDFAVMDQTTGARASLPQAVTYSAAVAPVRSAAATVSTLYIAAGQTSPAWNVAVTLTSNGLPAAGVAVTWKLDAGLRLASADTVTDAHGRATASVAATGLAAGSHAKIAGCGWATVCEAAGEADGVGPTEWQLTLVSGAGQSLAAPAAFSPVVLAVSDLAGHPVIAAPVSVYQTVSAWEGACSAARCASAPVLATTISQAASGTDSTLTMQPLQVNGAPGETALTAVSGTNGYTTLTLISTP